MPETNFFWDQLSDNILQERDETGVVTAEYTTEPGLYGNLISQNRAGVESQYHFDALGTTLALTDDNQQVTDTYAYTAFGEVTEHTGSTVNPFQYIGQKGYYKDEVTEEYAVRRRPLSPAYGRWLPKDPAQFINGMNLYDYVHNRSVSATDPSGLIVVGVGCCCCCADRITIDISDKPWNSETWFGHLMWITLHVSYPEVPVVSSSDCTLEWWEMFDIPPSDMPQYKSMRWLNVARIPPHIKLEDQWAARGRFCGTSEESTGEDNPVLEKTGTGVRNLWIKLVIKSDPVCSNVLPCLRKQVSACIHQRLKVDDGIPDFDPKETYIEHMSSDDCAKWNPPRSLVTPGADPIPKP